MTNFLLGDINRTICKINNWPNDVFLNHKRLVCTWA